MLERNAAEFSILDGIGETMTLHPREVVRLLADRVLELSGGDLADDATLMTLDWHGPPGPRHVDEGSDTDRASAPMP